MQCKTCDYPLWNLKARQCPECGAPFVPSEFEFVINSVRYCCPHCNQAYYGTGNRGELVPAEFVCVNCSQPVTMDDMVVFPAAGVQEHQTKVHQAPWLVRERIGRAKAWFKTVFQGLFMPNNLIRGVPPESSAGQAWWYAIITAVTFAALNLGVFVGCIGVLSFVFGGGGGGGSGALGFGMGMGISVLSMAVGLLLLALVWALVTHGMLLLLGGGQWGIGRTFHAICYSMGGAALIAFPLLGVYPFGFVPLLWWMVSAMMMMAIAQGVSPGKAIIATGVFPLVMTLVVFGGFFVLMYIGMTTAQTAITQAAAAAESNAIVIMNDHLIPFAETEGEYPPFAMVAVDGDAAMLSDFVSQVSFTEHERVMIGEVSLLELMTLEADEIRAHVDAIAEAMPADVIAHRIGDFVFTYNGLKLDKEDSELWIIVLASPPPPQGVPPFMQGGMSNQITVIMSDGSSVAYPLEQFDTALIEQNALRAAHGLPTLPDPRTITLDKPVVREGDVRETYGGVSP